jgi:hypothetical protein
VTKNRQPTIIALVDFERGEITAIVLYRCEDGYLTQVIGSSDFGPFDDYTSKLQWLMRNLKLREPVAPS